MALLLGSISAIMGMVSLKIYKNRMDKEFLTISELSKYLKIKPSTLYSWVKAEEIPHYRLHKIVRFKKEDIDAWIEGHKRESNSDKRVRNILKAIRKSKMSVDVFLKKTIDEVKGNRYNPLHGRPDQIKDLRREAEDGTL
jgi:excisionase family DNA binding protein